MSTAGPHHIRLEEDRWSTLRHIVEAVAIVAAGVWAFYTFIYQEKIKPASEPAALSDTIAIRSLGQTRTREIMGITLSFHNTGKTAIDIAADGYNVWGRRYGRNPIVRQRIGAARREYNADLPIVSQRLVASMAELRDMAVGGRKGQHIFIEPGAVDSISQVLAVPRGTYDIVRAQVFAVPVKRTRVEKVPVAIATNKVGGYWLMPSGSGVEEDDNTTDFVLP
jgi:hypothetical protein